MNDFCGHEWIAGDGSHHFCAKSVDHDERHACDHGKRSGEQGYTINTNEAAALTRQLKEARS